jgi:general secretion pathway protein H
MQRGFTLLELLVVLAILGVLLATVPAGLGAALPGMRLHAAAEMLVTDLQAARLQAIRGRHETAIELEPDRPGYRIAASKRELPSGSAIRLQAPDRRQSALRFLPDGSSNGGVLILSRDERAYRISVDWLTGRAVLDD